MNGSNDIDYFQNPFQISPRLARQYFMCPQCSFHLCFEHGQEYQQQIQHQIHSIQDHAISLKQTIQNYQPVQAIIEQVYKSLHEWKDKMFQFIDQYSEQIRSHIEHAQNRLNEQWNITKDEYLQLLENFVQEPIDRLLRSRILFYMT